MKSPGVCNDDNGQWLDDDQYYSDNYYYDDYDNDHDGRHGAC